MQSSKKWVAENAHVFKDLVDKHVCIKLNNIMLSDDVILQTILPTKLGDLENAPDMRKNGDKQYTPPCFTLVLDQGKLVFAIEDTRITATIRGGVKLNCGMNTIELEALDAYHNFA